MKLRNQHEPVMKMEFFQNDICIMKSEFYDCAFDYRKYINDVKLNLEYDYVLIKRIEKYKFV